MFHNLQSTFSQGLPDRRLVTLPVQVTFWSQLNHQGTWGSRRPVVPKAWKGWSGPPDPRFRSPARGPVRSRRSQSTLYPPSPACQPSVYTPSPQNLEHQLSNILVQGPSHTLTHHWRLPKGVLWELQPLTLTILASVVAKTVENLPAMQETWVGFPGWEDSPGEENGNPLQYSGLENFMDRGYSPWGHKEWDMTEQLTLSLFHIRNQNREMFKILFIHLKYIKILFKNNKPSMLI